MTFQYQRAGARPLTAQEEVRLARRIERGDLEAKNALVVAHLRLVAGIAARYRHQGVPLADLIQEGCIGLMRAAEKFDHRRGHRFSTYATWWVRQAISRAVAITGRPIRLPVPVVDKLRRIRRAEAQLASELGRTPSAAEVAERTALRAEQIQVIERAAQTVGSLDGGLSLDGCTAPMYDRVGAPVIPSEPEEADQGLATATVVSRLLAELSTIERRVLELRFGLNDNAPMSRANVARALSMTSWRVRYIEQRSVVKLRALLNAERSRGASPAGGSRRPARAPSAVAV